VDCRIEHLPSFEVVGKSMDLTIRNGQMFQEIPEFWARCDADGTTSALVEHMGPLGLIGVSLDRNFVTGEFVYLAGIEAPREMELPPDWSRHVLPATTWGKFDVDGMLPLALQAMIRDIQTRWIPRTQEWEVAGSFNLTRSPVVLPGKRDEMAHSEHHCEYWVPLRRKTRG
jgi:AraC family transcriptional regulator